MIWNREAWLPKISADKPWVLFAALSALCTRAPQANEPGYEFGLLAGITLPWLAGGFSAHAEQRAASSHAARFARSGLYAALTLLPPLLCTIGTQPCDLPGGILWVGSGACLGVFCASLLGALMGPMARTPNRAFWLGAAPPLLSLGLGLARFWATPSVHAYDAFVGYFAGTLYDTVIPLDARYAWSRVVPVALVLLVAFCRPKWRLRAQAAWVLLLFVEPRFGLLHHSTRALTERLVEHRDGTCVMHADDQIPAHRVDALQRQCEVDKRDVEAYFEVSAASVTVFVFRDAAQKQRLMGAGHTYIAKPWRHEVYVQDAGFPHPTLRHEIAHVVTAAFAQGPFKIAGSLGGWLPDPGRIEGFAVAAEGETESRRERVADMKSAGVIPPVSQVFSLDFLNAPGARSYTFAGAFVESVRARYGADALRRWYGGGELQALTGKTMAKLEQEFLQALPVGDQTHAAESKARYGGPGILARRCPHRIDSLRAEASRCVVAGDAARARLLLGEARLLAPGDVGLRFEDARLAGVQDDTANAYVRALLQDLDADPAWRSAAHELLGDRARGGQDSLGNVDLAEAAMHYREAAALVRSEDRRRLLELKTMALATDGPAALRKRFSMPAPARTSPSQTALAWEHYFALKDALNAGHLLKSAAASAALSEELGALRDSPLAVREAGRMIASVARYVPKK